MKYLITFKQTCEETKVNRRSRTVADLWQIKFGEVPPLQTVGGVSDVAGHRGLTVSY